MGTGAFTDDEISDLYKSSSAWSKDVAYAQAVCDFIAVVQAAAASSSNSNSNNIENGALMKLLLPSVSTMVPPDFSPIALECAMMYRKERKRAEAAAAVAEAEQRRRAKRARLS